MQYADYAVWQREWMEGEVLPEASGVLEGHTGWFTRRCWNYHADHARPAQQDYAGAFARLMLDEKLTRGLKGFEQAARDNTLYDVAGRLGVTSLARLSGQPDVVIGTPGGQSRTSMR